MLSSLAWVGGGTAEPHERDSMLHHIELPVGANNPPSRPADALDANGLVETSLVLNAADERVVRRHERFGQAMLFIALSVCVALAIAWLLHSYAGVGVQRPNRTLPASTINSTTASRSLLDLTLSAAAWSSPPRGQLLRRALAVLVQHPLG